MVNKDNKNKKSGFTLVELLVVISIIGILATVILTALGPAKKSGEVAHLVAQFDQIEKALYYTYLDEDRSTWWSEEELGTFNPTLQYLIDIQTGPMSTFSDWYGTNASNFLSESTYRFDNDGDPYGECGTGGQLYSGVNLLVYGIKFDDIYRIDKFVDGVESDSCGKIRYRVSAVTGEPLLIYSIDLNENV